MIRRLSFLLSLAVLASVLPIAISIEASAQTGPSEQDSPLAAARETEPVVLTGASFPTWSVPADITAKAPSIEGKQCLIAKSAPEQFPPVLWSDENCTHNQYEDPEVSTGEHSPLEGKPIDRLLGYRWDGERFVEIPFQVDEMAQRYLSNNNSGFAFFSETDPHHTYVFDREGFRWTAEDPANPCLARPRDGIENTPDSVKGLDTDDELVFMARDTGPAAPSDAELPPGMVDSYRVAVTDPANGQVSFAYVMLAAEDGPQASFNADNGYVRYERDADADVYLFSESSYENYGAAPKGAYFDPGTGQCVNDPNNPKQRRPGDQATITTPRYRFRYEGRWLMTDLRVAPATAPENCLDQGGCNYQEDLIDQWKARAFQQRPSGETPCCGFEEEVNNWGGSSMLMGERSGPVRTIRETWGADSGTNVVRREIFYRDEIRFGTFLRVHVIPPLDGIYAQWDYNALNVDTYYNQYNPDGVPLDGKNDERFGNSRLHVSDRGAYYCGQDEISEAIGAGNCETTPVKVGDPREPCQSPQNQIEQWWDQYIVANDPTGQVPDDPTGVCIFNDIDSPDPTFSGVNAGLNWEQVTGPYGTVVMRSGIKQFTPGGTAQSLLAVPYYRDDSCFDDGTGSNPGPHLDGRAVDGDEEDDSFWIDENGVRRPRECWDSDNPEHVALLAAEEDNSHPRFYQGSIGTHGIHILLIGDSDNAGTTLPITEIDNEQRMVVLPGRQGNVGETYGRHTEKPLVAVAHPEKREQASAEPGPTATTIEIVGDRSGQTTDSATLAARLSDTNGPVAGKELVFRLDGQVVGSAATDESGVAAVQVTLSGPARRTEQTAAFAGDQSHAASSASATFDVTLEDSTMELGVSRKGASYSASARLSESDTGSGLGGRQVRFVLNGETVATATTNSDGTATATFASSKGRQTDRIQAIFDGDDTYASSSASTESRRGQ
ncbi:MAG: hypothetical protein ACLGIB_09190 [Actinomycetota bacterium]